MKRLKTGLLALCLLSASGCSYIVDNQTRKAGEQLSATLMNFEDPQTVGQAMPTLLIIADSMASSEDASHYALLSAARIYGAYTGAFARDDRERQKILSLKGLVYAQKGSCKAKKKWCHVDRLNSDDFTAFVKKLQLDDIEVAYAYGSSLLAYIEAHNDDWEVVASLSRATQLMEFVARHNPTYDNAGAHLYLGAIASILPPAMGGQPEKAKEHFERAIKLTKGRNLLVKVEYARRYARITFDKELHHQLLTEVLAASPRQEGLTLMNTWAQKEAKTLLDDESAYFD